MIETNVEVSSSYRWIIVAAGMLGLFGALGLGRFSLGVMLPAMGEGLGLTYTQMGIVSTANFCGYLAAVLCCGFLNTLIGSRGLIFIGLFFTGASMVLVGQATSFIVVLILYSVTGVGSALTNVPIMALIVVWFDPALRGRATGLCVMGNGLGILVSGKLVPYLNLIGKGWQLSWYVLGAVVLAIALICLVLIRVPSTEKNRYGTVAKDLSRERNKKPAALYVAGGLYFLFGFTYVIYVTFIVTAIIQDRGVPELVAGNLWAWGGLISILSGPLFGYVSDKIGRKRALIVVFSLQTIAYLFAVWTDVAVSVYLSILCFSLAAFSVPTIMAALVGDLAGSVKAASWFGLITFYFGVGQILGPALAGTLAEVSGSFSSSFLMAAGMTAAAVCFSLLLLKESHKVSLK